MMPIDHTWKELETYHVTQLKSTVRWNQSPGCLQESPGDPSCGALTALSIADVKL
jgi:hypothetical protein